MATKLATDGLVHFFHFDPRSCVRVKTGRTRQVALDADKVTCPDCRCNAVTHEVIDFGPGPQDRSDCHFRGTEAECVKVVDDHKPNIRDDGRPRFCIQDAPTT